MDGRYNIDQLTAAWRKTAEALRVTADGYDYLADEWETYTGDPEDLWPEASLWMDTIGGQLETLGRKERRFVADDKAIEERIDRMVATEMGGASPTDRQWLKEVGIDVDDLPPAPAVTAPRSGVPWAERMFRPVQTEAGWRLEGKIPDNIVLPNETLNRLLAVYPTREAAGAAAVLVARWVETQSGGGAQ